MSAHLTLAEIGFKHQTDKAITHLYMNNYERYFGDIRGDELTILELGVAGGASIATWREYFPNAKVYGIDNNPACAGEGIYIGSQIDVEFLARVISEIGLPDIIIDDASHYGPFTIKTFGVLFPFVRPNGWYVVEDTHCFYDKTYGEAPDDGNSAVFNFFTSLARDVDVAGRGMTGNTDYAISVQNENFPPVPRYSRILDCMHIHPSLWFFKRKP